MAELRIACVTAVVLAGCWFIWSVWLVYQGWGAHIPERFELCNPKILQAIAWSVWTIVAPLWFLLEYELFNRAYPNPPDGELAKLKYNQDLAAKLWVAVVAVFLALYLGRDLKP